MKLINEEKTAVLMTFDKGPELWKHIDYVTYCNYEVSNYGRVRKKIDNTAYYYMKFRECDTSVGSYLYTKLCIGYQLYKDYANHQLVCRTFNGTPPNDGKRYEPNHEDGNKHNNHSSNLIWMTHSENTIHALKSGLRIDNLGVQVYDLFTDTSESFYSISEMSRVKNITRNEIKNLISRYSKVPYRDRYLFSFTKEKVSKVKRKHYFPVIAKDFVTGTIIFANSCNEMQYETGISAGTILLRVQQNKNTDNLLGGYVFKSNLDSVTFPNYDKELAIKSRKEYFENVKSKYSL